MATIKPKERKTLDQLVTRHGFAAVVQALADLAEDNDEPTRLVRALMDAQGALIEFEKFDDDEDDDEYADDDEDDEPEDEE